MACDVTLCMIVKNEAKTIRRTLDTVEGFVSEYIIGIDEAVSDGTEGIIRRWFKKRKKKGEIYYFKWKGDFSYARNLTLEKAKNTNWILILDGHEYIEEDERLRLTKIFDVIDSNVNFIYIQLLNKETGTLINQMRIFKNHLGFKYQGKVHNILRTPEHNIIKEGTLIEGILLIHDRAKEQITKRADMRADMIITNMEKELETNPADTKSLFYLSRQFLLLKNFDKASHYGKRYVDICRDTYSKAVALSNLAICCFAKKDEKTGLKYLDEAMETDNNYPYPFIMLALYAWDKKEFEKSEKYLEEALKRNKVPRMTFLPIPVGFYSWFPPMLMADVKCGKGEYTEALSYIDMAYSYKKFFIGTEEGRLEKIKAKILEKMNYESIEAKVVLDSYYYTNCITGGGMEVVSN